MEGGILNLWTLNERYGRGRHPHRRGVAMESDAIYQSAAVLLLAALWRQPVAHPSVLHDEMSRMLVVEWQKRRIDDSLR